MIINKFNTKYFQITVEEVDRKDNPYICTYWNKEDCLIEDRRVFEYETYGGAVSRAFEILSDKYEEIYEIPD